MFGAASRSDAGIVREHDTGGAGTGSGGRDIGCCRLSGRTLQIGTNSIQLDFLRNRTKQSCPSIERWIIGFRGGAARRNTFLADVRESHVISVFSPN